ncbi:MAG: dicarboxylate/amino acid:cation symporter [Protaetiibacter sp.]
MTLDLLSLAALGVVLALYAGLWFLARRRVDFALRTLLALGVGIGVGVAFRGGTDYLDPLGAAYLNVLTAIVAPLIIVSILASVVELGGAAELKGVGLRSVFWLALSTLIAILLTLGLALAVGVGKGAGNALATADDPEVDRVVTPFTQVFVDFFPSNIVADLAANDIIPIIVFTVLIAVSYSAVAHRKPEVAKPFGDFTLSARAIIYKAVGYVIRLTPYAVLALTASATDAVLANLDVLWSLLGVLALSYVACLGHAFLVNSVLLRVWADVSPWQFFRKFFPAQATAFTTQSSVGTLPVTTGVLTQRIGVPGEIAGFTAPLGTTIGMPGCSGVWPILVAVFAINALGLDYGITDYLVLILIAMLVSFGTAGVPGTATVTATTVLVAAGLPVEVMVVTLPISALADMARTLSNVTAAGVSATIVARQEGRLDRELFDSRELAELDLDTPVRA